MRLSALLLLAAFAACSSSSTGTVDIGIRGDDPPVLMCADLQACAARCVTAKCVLACLPTFEVSEPTTENLLDCAYNDCVPPDGGMLGVGAQPCTGFGDGGTCASCVESALVAECTNITLCQ